MRPARYLYQVPPDDPVEIFDSYFPCPEAESAERAAKHYWERHGKIPTEIYLVDEEGTRFHFLLEHRPTFVATEQTLLGSKKW